MAAMIERGTPPVPLRLEVTPPDGVAFVHELAADELVIRVAGPEGDVRLAL